MRRASANLLLTFKENEMLFPVLDFWPHNCRTKWNTCIRCTQGAALNCCAICSPPVNGYWFRTWRGSWEFWRVAKHQPEKWKGSISVLPYSIPPFWGRSSDKVSRNWGTKIINWEVELKQRSKRTQATRMPDREQRWYYCILLFL